MIHIGLEHPTTMITLSNYGLHLGEKGDFIEAVSVNKMLYELRLKVSILPSLFSRSILVMHGAKRP